MKNPITILQSTLSVAPPCPGIATPKSLILKALFKPLARNPPKGAITEAKRAMIAE